MELQIRVNLFFDRIYQLSFRTRETKLFPAIQALALIWLHLSSQLLGAAQTKLSVPCPTGGVCHLAQ